MGVIVCEKEVLVAQNYSMLAVYWQAQPFQGFA
jgi:hypothetical protein